MKKLLHERLREYGSKCHADYTEWFKQRHANELADEIEKYYIPRPRFEDGEPVQFGDEVELHYKSGGCEKGRIQAWHVNKGTVWTLSFVGVDHERLYRYDSEIDVLKRSAPKVLDADGVEIKAGENRFSIEHGYEVIVNQVNPDYCICSQLGNGCTLGSSGYKPSDLTHREPDSLSKFRDDLENKYGKESSWVKRLTAIMERDA